MTQRTHRRKDMSLMEDVASIPGIANLVTGYLNDFDKQMLRRVNKFWRNVLEYAPPSLGKNRLSGSGVPTVAIPWLSLTTSTAMLEFMTLTEDFTFNLDSKSWCSGYHLKKLVSSVFGRNNEPTWEIARQTMVSIQPNIRACITYGQPSPDNPLDVIRLGKTLWQGTEASFVMTETNDFKTVELYYSRLSVYYQRLWYADFQMAKTLNGEWLPGMIASSTWRSCFLAVSTTSS